MRINNDVSRVLLLEGIGCTIFGCILLYVYFYTSDGQSFNSDDWLIIFLLVGVSIVGYVMIIFAIIKRVVNRGKDFYLKSVDFLSDRVSFYFNKPKYNFVCAYSDINNLEMELQTILAFNRIEVFSTLSQIIIHFNILNNKKFSLTTSTINHTNKIYQILDCRYKVKNFSYQYTGYGSVIPLEEKIQHYLETGCKKNFSDKSKNLIRALAIFLFVCGLIQLIAKLILFNGYNDFLFWAISSIPIVAAFVMFIIIYEKK